MRLSKQLSFILELDKLKRILRQTELSDCSRAENSAEHSWHVALMALVLAEHADEPIDVVRVIKMLLVHDVVEIDAGDTPLYDEAAMEGKRARERVAAQRLFGLLPDDQRAELRALWDEFEAAETPDARFAAAIDRLSPCMLNLESEGSAWVKLAVPYDRAFEKNSQIGRGSSVLWEHARTVLEQARQRGFLADD